MSDKEEDRDNPVTFGRWMAGDEERRDGSRYSVDPDH